MGRQAVQLQCKRKLIYFNYIHTTPNYPGHRFILTEMDNEITTSNSPLNEKQVK